MTAGDVVLAYIPSPPQGVWHLGPFPLRAYALCIIVGIILAVWWGDRRWQARGGRPGDVLDVALISVPFGLIGGRLYHVITDWWRYFGDDGKGLAAVFQVWDGGLGIWGAVALGAVGAWIGCRWKGIKLPPFGDALAPAVLAAQAIGRLGNYFNQELYGDSTTVPWGLELYQRVNPETGATGVSVIDGVSNGHVVGVVHPTFLYELVWNLLIVALLVFVDRRFTIGHGRLFAMYVAGYCAGRFWIELMRTDEATHILGLRVNVLVSALVFLGAALYIVMAPRGREQGYDVFRPERAEAERAADLEAGVVDDLETTPADTAAAETAAAEPAEEAADSWAPAPTAVLTKESDDAPVQDAEPEPEAEAEPVADAEIVDETDTEADTVTMGAADTAAAEEAAAIEADAVVADEAPVDEVPVEDAPVEDALADDVPEVDVPDVDVPDADVPDADVPDADVPEEVVADAVGAEDDDVVADSEPAADEAAPEVEEAPAEDAVVTEDAAPAVDVEESAADEPTAVVVGDDDDIAGPEVPTVAEMREGTAPTIVAHEESESFTVSSDSGLDAITVVEENPGWSAGAIEIRPAAPKDAENDDR